MRVLLVGNYRPDEQYSMLGFEEILARELARMGIDVRTGYPKSRLGNLSTNPQTRKWLAYADKYLLFPKELRAAQKQVDIVHLLDQGNALYLRHIRHVPHLVTCHDLLALQAALGEMPGWEVSASGRRYLSMIRRSLAKARQVACVSNRTRRDFERLIGGSAQTHLLPNSLYRPCKTIGRDEAAARLLPLGFDPRVPFILHVGGNQPYKNRIGAVRIHRHLLRLMPDPLRLVLAGHELSAEILELAGDSAGKGEVVHLRKPTNDQLEALYSLAEGLLFPSFVEGFGLPILEAMHCGCPVFTSDREPMTELARESAVYFNPEDPECAARSISDSWHLRSEMAERGLALASGWSPAEMARKYLALYQEVLA